jgi:hypothetical protein
MYFSLVRRVVHFKVGLRSIEVYILYKITKMYISVKDAAMKMMITLPEEMHKVLQEISVTEDKVIAAIIRRAVSEYLKRTYNIDVEHNMKWGGGAGKREGEKED